MNLYAYAGNNPVAFTDPFGLCGSTAPDSIQIEVKVVCPNGDTIQVKVWASGDIQQLNSAAQSLVGGDRVVTPAAIAHHYQMATAGGAVYVHPTRAAGGNVITGARTTTTHMSFRSDLWANISGGLLNQPTAGTNACNVVGHEGVHLLQTTASTPLSGLGMNETEASSYSWTC